MSFSNPSKSCRYRLNTITYPLSKVNDKMAKGKGAGRQAGMVFIPMVVENYSRWEKPTLLQIKKH